MPGLLDVVRPRWPHLPLGRSRQAGLDILGHIFFENLLTQHGPSHTSIGLRDSAAAPDQIDVGVIDAGCDALVISNADGDYAR